MHNEKKRYSGFTLVELIIYVGIVAIAGSFMGGILLNVTRVQNRQVSSSEVNQQLQFVMQHVQRLIKESSAIDIDQGVATSTLTLRMKDEPTDPDKGFPTRIYANNGIIYLLEGQNSPQPLTTSQVKADTLSFLKISNPPGHDSVQIDIALSTNTENPEQSFSQTLSSAVARVSAATFDADLIPGATSYDIGNNANPWNDLHLGRDLYVGRATILGNLASAPPDVVGSIYYDTTTNTFRGRNNTSWTDFGSTGPWTVAGNDIYNNNTGNVGINKNNPSEKLDVVGNAIVSDRLGVGGGVSSVGAKLNITGGTIDVSVPQGMSSYRQWGSDGTTFRGNFTWKDDASRWIIASAGSIHLAPNSSDVLTNGVIVNGSGLTVNGTVTANAYSYNRGCTGGAPTGTYGGHCYVKFVAPAGSGIPWTDAMAYCRAWGGDLAVITSAAEQNFIFNNIFTGSSAAWVGLNAFGVSSGYSTKANWNWINREPVSYDGWNGSPSGGAFACAYMNSTGTWNNDDCNTNHHFICESE